MKSLERTYSILIQQIYFLADYQIMQKTSVGIDKKDGHIVYTGSLIKSYIHFHFTPRWNTLNSSKQITKTSWFLNPSRTRHTECWKTLFQHQKHSKKSYQEVFIQPPLHKNKWENKTPEKCVQEPENISHSSAAEQWQHLNLDQGTQWTSILEFL